MLNLQIQMKRNTFNSFDLQTLQYLTSPTLKGVSN